MPGTASIKVINQQIIWFAVLCFGFGILLSLFIGVTGGQDSKFIGAKYFSMLIPAIAVLFLTWRFNTPVMDPVRNSFPVAWLPVALLLMPVAIHTICLPVYAYLNNQQLIWQTWLTPDQEGFYHVPESRGWGTISSSQLEFRILINATTGLILVSLLAIFEEVGWRAWLLSRLLKKYSIKKALFIGALIWAIWHIPFILSGIQSANDLRLYHLLIFNPVGIFGTGIVIGWLWLKTNSIWIVSLAHGALNDWGQYAFKYLEDLQGLHESVWLLASLNGSLFILGMIVLATLRNEKRDGGPSRFNR
jgi:membrane protease YdiL (CAAX protease family)